MLNKNYILVHEDELRAEVVKEALSWVGTPFHDHAGVKEAGVDCLHFLYAPYKVAGIIGDVEIPHYSPQWYLNRDEDRLIEAITQMGGREITSTPKPADVVVIKIGRVFAHSAIVVDWPTVIHAHPLKECVAIDRADIYNLFAYREKKFFSYWPKLA